jgi:hypothetical protein
MMSEGLKILPHHLDDAPARAVGGLAALAIGRRDRGRAGQHHAERLGERVHGRGRAHRVAMADEGAEEPTMSMNWA